MLQATKQKVKGLLKQAQKNYRRANPLPIHKITADLEKLPINEGDSLFIHTRLSSIGYIRGDVRAILDTLIKKVGEEGHLFVPGFSSQGSSLEYVRSGPTFDVLETPSRMGMLTEIFRKEYENTRSYHPTHSVMVYGKDRDSFTNEQHLDPRPFAEKSPFYKFLELKNTKVLCLGMTIFPITLFRVYETVHYDNYPVPVFVEETFPIDVIGYDRKMTTMTTMVHNPVASNIRRNMLFENYFLEQGLLKPFKIGRSTSFLLDTTDFYGHIERQFKKGNMPYMGYFKEMERYHVDEKRLFQIPS